MTAQTHVQPQRPAASAVTGYRRTGRAAPAVIAVGVTAIAGGGLLLAVLNRITVGQALAQFFVASTAAALSFGTVGTLVAVKRPGLSIGRLFCAVGVATAIPPVAAQYARYALLTHRGALPGGQFAAWVADCSWPIGYGLLLVGVPLLFPTGRLPAPRWRTVGWLGAVAVGFSVVGSALTPAANPDLPEVPNPYGISGAAGIASALFDAGTLLLAAAAIAAVISLVVRYRASAGRERDQLRWLIFAALGLAVTEIGVPLGGLVAGVARDPAVLGYAEGVAAPWMAVAVAVAVLHHRLYDIDLWINRTLVYATMTGLVAAGYVLVVGYLGNQLDVHGTGVGLLAAGAVAVAFHPARDLVQRGVNRLVYGHRDEPYTALVALGRRLESTLSPGAVLTTIAATVREALRVPYVRVELTGVPGHAEAGTERAVAVSLPLQFGTDQVGMLAVASRTPADPLTPADLTLLADCARQAGVAVHAVRLTADLQAARERLVSTREEERRRLRRELHDGLGPQLASQSLALDAARTLLRTDPDAADALLTDLRQQVQQAVGEIRRIAHGLRPPALDDGGLVGALREHAARYQRTGLAVTVDACADLSAMPAAVEVAAYRIATEAITNTARHAGATRCAVTLTMEPADGDLQLEIVDDGRGLPADRRAGVGLASMAERAAELGGSVQLDCPPGGGARVRAQLPTAADCP